MSAVAIQLLGQFVEWTPENQQEVPRSRSLGLILGVAIAALLSIQF
ncbi:MAG TPA: hypothetical protein VHZ74_18270 [Bryobacteraceae bacterium]|jgi:hypothetical protein|nr:hypothetical protein [Bryobacteraceae bacterium]